MDKCQDATAGYVTYEHAFLVADFKRTWLCQSLLSFCSSATWATWGSLEQLLSCQMCRTQSEGMHRRGLLLQSAHHTVAIIREMVRICGSHPPILLPCCHPTLASVNKHLASVVYHL